MGDKYLLRNAWPNCLLVSPVAVVTLPFSPGWSGELGGGCVRTGSFFFSVAELSKLESVLSFFGFLPVSSLALALLPYPHFIFNSRSSSNQKELPADRWCSVTEARGPWECVCACVCDLCCSDAISVPVVCLSEKPLLFLIYLSLLLLFLLIRFTETGLKLPEC